MFGFGKKKTPVVPPPREKRQRTSGKSKEDYKEDLAKLGLLGIDGVDVDDDGSGSEIDEGDLEDELMAIIGVNDESMDTLIPENNRKLPQLQPQGVMPTNDPNIESLFKGPPPPVTIFEALDQRLKKYKSELEKATKDGEGASKCRRIGRIVKQYEEAIVACNKGRPVAFDELPTPPGYAPIPLPSTSISKPPVLPTPPKSKTPDSLIIRQLSLQLDEDDDEEVSDTELPSELMDEFISNDIPSHATNDEPLISLTPPLVVNKKPVSTDDATKKTKQIVPSIESPQRFIGIADIPVDNEKLSILIQRQKQYKEAALLAKRSADITQAREFLRIAKGFDKLIQEVGEGLDVDLTCLPPPPSPPSSSPEKVQDVKTAAPEPPPIQIPPPETDEVPAPAMDIFNAPPPPRSILEALEQRLEKYKSEVDKANETSNSGKARRMGRIVKQYEDSIKAHKKGQPVAFDELPTPPGFGPIPVPGTAAQTPSAATQPAQLSNFAASVVSPQPNESPAAAPLISPQSQLSSGSINRGANKPQTKLTLQEKQLRFLVERQKKFKEAALNAKKRGDIGQAKEFLKNAKGFDKLIEASQAGLPVDMATVPSPPEAVSALELETSEDFEIIRSIDCLEGPSGGSGEIFSKLEEDLREQLKMCMRTRDHFKSMGDVASGNRFEKLAIETKKDLDTLRLAAKRQEELPKYHYETRIFSITECNSDLADDEIEISILKGINYKVPNPADVDTFIKVELPYPSAEEVQTNKTTVVRDTNNPDYSAIYKMKINKSARNFHRFIHRHGIKLELWSKGGFLRSSTLLGVATVKLLPLETKCTLHDAFEVVEGRKSVGKVEVKVRLRDPVLTKQITQKKEKWLSIDRI